MRTASRCSWALPALAIVVAAVTTYLPALRAGFVFDDHVLVEQSALLRGPLWRIWFSTAPHDYWPLTWTSLWAEWRIWGERASGYHAVNLALHVTTSLLLWRTLRALEVPGAWLAALLFAVHPVGVESVAWISERKNTLSAVLFFGTLLAWLRFDQEGHARHLALSLFLFACTLLSKTSAVMLPFLLLGTALWRRGVVTRRDWLRVVPFVLLSGVLGAATLWFQRARAIQDHMLPWRGPAERVGGAAWALGSYLRRAFLPVDVAFVYPEWPLRPDSPWFYLPLLAAAIAAVALWRSRRGWGRPVAYAIGYHALMVLPVLGLLDLAYFGVGPVSNHLQYLALAGPCALIAGGVTLALRTRWRIASIAALAMAVLCLSAATFARAATFESDLTLWEAAARASPDSLFAVWMYSDELAARGRRQEALSVLATASERARDAAVRHRSRSLWLLHSGFYTEALAEAQEANRSRPNPEFQSEVGQLLTRAGRPAQAIELLAPLVAEAPRNVDFRYALGAALSRSGRLAEAVDLLRESCRIAPDDTRSREALSLLLARMNRAEDARGAP